jgi:hypothetical protein
MPLSDPPGAPAQVNFLWRAGDARYAPARLAEYASNVAGLEIPEF